MRKITITASDGEKIAGQLPQSWAEVGFKAYADLAATAQTVPDGITPTAHVFANVAGCHALATLLDLPTADPLLTDVSLLLTIYDAAPWLFVGPLPAADEPTATFTHLGTTYDYAGGLDKATGGQMEALLAFLNVHEGNPLGAGPALLAVLYTPTGQPQTPETVKVAALALETLPMSVAWPCVQAFLSRSAPTAMLIQKYLALRPQVEKLLSALETPLQHSASPGHCSNLLRWLTKAYLKRVRKALTAS